MTIRTISPVDGSVYAERTAATAAQIDQTLQRATEASISENMAFTINANDFKSDTYKGSAKIFIDSQDEPLLFDSITLCVKDNPIWTLLVLTLGLTAGRFIRIYNSQDLQNFYQLMDRINSLKRRAQAVKMPATDLEKIEAQVRSSNYDLPATKTKLAEIESKIYFLEHPAPVASLKTEIREITNGL